MATKLYSAREAAEKLGVSHIYVRKLLQKGVLKGQIVGDAGYVIEEAILERFKASRDKEEHRRRAQKALRANLPKMERAFGTLVTTWHRARLDVTASDRRVVDRALSELQEILP